MIVGQPITTYYSACNVDNLDEIARPWRRFSCLGTPVTTGYTACSVKGTFFHPQKRQLAGRVLPAPYKWKGTGYHLMIVPDYFGVKELRNDLFKVVYPSVIGAYWAMTFA